MIERMITAVRELKEQHDRHMEMTYAKMAGGDNDVTAELMYGAGLQHAIRTLEDVIDSNRRQ